MDTKLIILLIVVFLGGGALSYSIWGQKKETITVVKEVTNDTLRAVVDSVLKMNREYQDRLLASETRIAKLNFEKNELAKKINLFTKLDVIKWRDIYGAGLSVRDSAALESHDQ